MIVAHRFFLISGPRVRVPGDAPDIERQIVRFGVLFCYVTPKKSGSVRSMHGFCTVGVFIGILCMGWNCFEMRGKFCIKSTEPDGTEPLYFGVCILQLSTCGAGSGNKKSPHNDLNLTVPSGMALVRVRKERTGRCQPS